MTTDEQKTAHHDECQTHDSDHEGRAGPGQEGVAFIRSRGRRAACRAAGARVTLVHGLMQAALPAALHETVSAARAQDMYREVMARAADNDIFIAVAAVADYTVKNAAAHKIKKDGSGMPPVIELAENPDILAAAAALPHPPFCVGFAAESRNVLEYARAKRLKKNIPLIAANDVSLAMGGDDNQITLIDKHGETALPKSGKDQAAAAIVGRITHLLEEG